MTVNYLLDALYPSAAPMPPVGIIDLGGGSVQIVFASSTGKGLKHMDFGGRGHDTYIKSHLGYGLDEARRRTLELAISRWETAWRYSGDAVEIQLTLALAPTPTLTPTLTRSSRSEKPARNPCLPRGAQVEHAGVSVAGEGDWARCLKLTSRLFADDTWSLTLP